jgi:hypothetical protein
MSAHTALQTVKNGMHGITIEIKRPRCRNPGITRNGKKTTASGIAAVPCADTGLLTAVKKKVIAAKKCARILDRAGRRLYRGFAGFR